MCVIMPIFLLAFHTDRKLKFFNDELQQINEETAMLEREEEATACAQGWKGVDRNVRLDGGRRIVKSCLHRVGALRSALLPRRL